jgi:phosphoglycolate phosphatase
VISFLPGECYISIRIMKVKAVLFDLDGTLLNTLRDISDSANSVLSSFGFPQHKEESYRLFIGRGPRALAIRALPEIHRDESTVDKMASRMAEEYSKRAVSNTVPYPGIPELLDHLATIGIKMAILSNKPQSSTELTVSTLLRKEYFEMVIGAQPSLPLKPDPTSAFQIARWMNITPVECVFVGDSDIDMKTAKAANMCPVGVLWGFQTAEELRLGGAKKLIRKPSQLLSIISST